MKLNIFFATLCNLLHRNSTGTTEEVKGGGTGSKR